MKRKNFMLTQHISYNDMTHSAWADRCHRDNTPDSLQMAALENLCRVLLEPLWCACGPLTIKGAFHSPAVNVAMHETGASLHLTGEAVDLVLPDIEKARDYYRFIVNHVDFDQVFYEYRRNGDIWLHCSVRLDSRENRHQAFPNLVPREQGARGKEQENRRDNDDDV
jgi:hypothetical protein